MKRSFTFFASPRTLPSAISMPTTSADLALSPSSFLANRNLRTRSMVTATSGDFTKAEASEALANSFVAFNCASKPARSVPEALPMAVRAAMPFSPGSVMMDMVSYQMPARAFPKSGLSFSTPVLATIRSMISPGILELSNTLWALFSARISETSGFQVTTAVTALVL